MPLTRLFRRAGKGWVVVWFNESGQAVDIQGGTIDEVVRAVPTAPPPKLVRRESGTLRIGPLPLAKPNLRLVTPRAKK